MGGGVGGPGSWLGHLCLTSSARLSLPRAASEVMAAHRGLNCNMFHMQCCCCFFQQPHLWHMEVPRLGVSSEIQLPVYARATATRDLSRVFDLHHSSRQRQILNPRTRPGIESATSWLLVRFVSSAPQQELPPSGLSPEMGQFSIPTVLPFPECPVNRIIQSYVDFWSGFFHLAQHL